MVCDVKRLGDVGKDPASPHKLAALALSLEDMHRDSDPIPAHTSLWLWTSLCFPSVCACQRKGYLSVYERDPHISELS